MQWLTTHGARVLNAHNAYLEVNKVDQLLAFTQHGLRIPRTWVFNHVNQLPLLPKDFPFPLLVKPAQGET
jgi:glutathione synthase/RimK-type ligase-like ATP-grasp enzyme